MIYINNMSEPIDNLLKKIKQEPQKEHLKVCWVDSIEKNRRWVKLQSVKPFVWKR